MILYLLLELKVDHSKLCFVNDDSDKPHVPHHFMYELGNDIPHIISQMALSLDTGVPHSVLQNHPKNGYWQIVFNSFPGMSHLLWSTFLTSLGR